MDQGGAVHTHIKWQPAVKFPAIYGATQKALNPLCELVGVKKKKKDIHAVKPPPKQTVMPGAAP